MKSIVLSSVAIAMLVFSGCADKDPVVEKKTQPIVKKDTRPAKKVDNVQVDNIQTETVSSDNMVINENKVTNSESEDVKIARLENELATVYFDFDKFNIRSDMKERVSTNSKVVNGPAYDYAIKLEGNCDEWGSDEYNFALGLKRASSVKKALVARGISSSRISMVSYGENNPVCRDETKECWAKNRRVDFKLLP